MNFLCRTCQVGYDTAAACPVCGNAVEDLRPQRPESEGPIAAACMRVVIRAMLKAARDTAADDAYRIKPGRSVRVTSGKRVPFGVYTVECHWHDGNGTVCNLVGKGGQKHPRVPVALCQPVPCWDAVGRVFSGELGPFLAGWCKGGCQPLTVEMLADWFADNSDAYATLLNEVPARCTITEDAIAGAAAATPYEFSEAVREYGVELRTNDPHGYAKPVQPSAACLNWNVIPSH